MNRKERRSTGEHGTGGGRGGKPGRPAAGGRPRLLLTDAFFRHQEGNRHALRPRVLDALAVAVMQDFPDGIDHLAPFTAFALKYNGEALFMGSEPVRAMALALAGLPPDDDGPGDALGWELELGARRSGAAHQSPKPGILSEDDHDWGRTWLMMLSLYMFAHRRTWILAGGTGGVPAAPGAGPGRRPPPAERAWLEKEAATRARRAAQYRADMEAGKAWTLDDPKSPYHPSKTIDPWTLPEPPRPAREGCRLLRTYEETEGRGLHIRWLEVVDDLHGLRPPESRMHDGREPWPVSPRESIRPHLERIGRLDLLERYWDGSEGWQPPVRDAYYVAGLTPHWPHEGNPPLGEPEWPTPPSEILPPPAAGTGEYWAEVATRKTPPRALGGLKPRHCMVVSPRPAQTWL